jgi:hypothetical protein
MALEAVTPQGCELAMTVKGLVVVGLVDKVLIT